MSSRFAIHLNANGRIRGIISSVVDPVTKQVGAESSGKRRKSKFAGGTPKPQNPLEVEIIIKIVLEMKSFCLLALIATTSAIKVSDISIKSVDPWVHDYLKDALPTMPLSRKDAPLPNSYPPYGNAAYWPEVKETQTDKDLKAIAIKKMDEEDAAAAAAKPAPPAAKKENKAPTEEQ